jgi:hypothetical protein
LGHFQKFSPAVDLKNERQNSNRFQFRAWKKDIGVVDNIGYVQVPGGPNYYLGLFTPWA